MDPRGVTNYLMRAHFTSDGQLLMSAAVSGTGGSGEQMSTSTYKLTGPSSYTGKVLDYQPKDIPPFLVGRPGSKFSCTFKFENHTVLDITCGSGTARFTRQG